MLYSTINIYRKLKNLRCGIRRHFHSVQKKRERERERYKYLQKYDIYFTNSEDKLQLGKKSAPLLFVYNCLYCSFVCYSITINFHFDVCNISPLKCMFLGNTYITLHTNIYMQITCIQLTHYYWVNNTGW